MIGSTRRDALKLGLAGTAVTLTPLMVHGAATQSPKRKLLAEGAFARMEEVGDGIIAITSTPIDSQGNFAFPQTLCNGGIIVGDERILAFDGYYQPEGAAWVAAEIKRLFNRPINDVLVSHCHLDHIGGLAGFQQGAEGPDIIMTAATWGLAVEKYSRGRPIEDSAFAATAAKIVGPTRVIADESKAIDLNIGGRGLTIQPLAGHTPSDLALLVDDARVTFGGDLAWWGLFPNYVDAVPSALTPSVKALMSGPNRLMVTGHGDLVNTADMQPYLDLILSVEQAAIEARDKGLTSLKAAERYKMPKSTEGWGFFSPRYPERAIASWLKEWSLG